MRFRTWTWSVSTSQGTICGTSTGIDARDALSRGLTTEVDGGMLAGEALGVDTRLLGQVPANAELEPLQISEGEAFISLRPASLCPRHMSLLNVVRLADSPAPTPRG